MKSLTRNESQSYIRAAWKRLDQLTKPPRSLGRLEEIAAQLCGIQRSHSPQTRPRSVILFAGDHGICEEGVSAFPQSVTVEMLKNMSNGGAAVCVLSTLHQAALRIIDVGSLLPTGQHLTGVERRVIRSGSRNFIGEPAMTVSETLAAMDIGREIIREEARRGTRFIILGEMGIGNTTSAAAITAAILKRPPAEVTGRGTGLQHEGFNHKIRIIRQALIHHQNTLIDATTILSCLGGYEIAALSGAVLEAADQTLPVLLDGFIVSAAALVAFEMNPYVRECILPSHVSTEKGHPIILDHLQLSPFIDLNLRLGEAGGALVALPIFDAAAAIYNQMATFESAKVSSQTSP